MITINTHEAKTKLSALLTAVQEHGEVVLICRNGKPVAELRQPSQASPISHSRLTPDPVLAGRILYDPTEPATDDEWPQDAR